MNDKTDRYIALIAPALALCMTATRSEPSSFCERWARSSCSYPSAIPSCLPWTACRTSPVLSAGLVALFAVFHGYAHGVEMPGNALWSYGFGFVLATALLHGVGILAGLSLRNRAAWLRAAGALVVISGLWIATFA